MNPDYRYLNFLLMLLFTASVCAQTTLNSNMLGCQSRVCVEIVNEHELIRAYELGIRAYIPGKGSSKQLLSILNELEQLQNSESASGAILMNNYYDAKTWDYAINKSGIIKRMVYPPRLDKKDLFNYELSKRDVISFSRAKSATTYHYDELLINFELDSLNNKLVCDFLMANAKSSQVILNDTTLNRNWLNRYNKHLHNSLIYLSDIWVTTGKRPQFIKCEMADIPLAKELSEVINSINFYSVHFIKNKEAFAPVRKKENSIFCSGGRVTIPVINNNPLQLSPKSKGYRFSPDIFRFTAEHKWQEITINAFPLAINKTQIVHFHFEDASKPVTPNIESIFSTSDALLLEDEQRGKVFSFNGISDYIDCGSSLDIDFLSPITISAWIKPEKKDQNHSIVGMGNSFTMKIQRKHLTFTSPDSSDIRFSDHEIILNKWQHVAIVFEPNERVSLYQNGRLIGSTEATEILKSKHSILIGSNLWGEYYKGLIDDLIIWNRALSDDEIKQLSVPQAEIKTDWYQQMLVATISSLLIILLLVVIRKYKRTVSSQLKLQSKKESAQPAPASEPHNLAPVPHQLSILTFGEFRIFTAEGNNIVPQLSPKEKQLLLYLLWHSIRNKKEGVTSRQMSEDLWPNMSAEKAKNNRSTYMQRLRKQLTDTTGIQINYASNKKWCLVIPESFKCDLQNYNLALEKLRTHHSVNNLQQLLSSLSEGSFLPETHSDVTDVFKSEIENEIIITLTNPEIVALAENEVNILPLLTATIRKYDPVNETALSLEINWFHKMGHHGRTKESYQRFCREYELLFGEKFGLDMEELIN